MPRRKTAAKKCFCKWYKAPRSRKPPPPPERYYEVEKVCDDKVVDGQRFYLIKWKNYEDKDWIESWRMDFCVTAKNAYWRRKNQAAHAKSTTQSTTKAVAIVEMNDAGASAAVTINKTQPTVERETIVIDSDDDSIDILEF